MNVLKSEILLTRAVGWLLLAVAYDATSKPGWMVAMFLVTAVACVARSILSFGE